MDGADLVFAGLSRQAELLATGEVSARELVDASLERIERLNPRLNSFRVVYAERARAEADQVQAELSAAGDGPRRPLLGVPVAIKDDIDVAGELTTYGSRAHGPAAERDAEVVARLRSAGAIVIGKTNVPELMIFPFTESEAFGITRNPHDPDRIPGGSSGGTASAVASGMVGGGLGSDGGGSIRIPAACCGLFGIKPQRGRLSLSPRREAWNGLSCIGPITRTVRDAALILDVASGAAPGDVERARDPEGSFLAAAQAPSGRLRIACSRKVPPGLMARVGSPQRQALEQTAELLRSLGHQVAWEDPDYGLAGLRFVQRYLRGIHDDAHGMADFERLEPRTRGMARLGSLVRPGRLAAARRAEIADGRRINAIYDRHDVVITPVLASAPPPVGKWTGQGAVRTLNGVSGFVPFCGLWNHLGQPAASVPVGVDDQGLPLSVQLLGRANDEHTLLALAAQMEAERPWAQRRPAVS